MRRRDPPASWGRTRSRWRIVVVDNGLRKSFFYESREEALRQKSALAKEVDLPPSRLLTDVLADWEQEKVRSGACKPKSAQHQTSRVSRFLRPMLDAEIATVTPRRAAALSERRIGQASCTTRQALSAATHRFDPRTAKRFFNWAVKRGCLGLNPFKDVSPVGKARAGKLQLRIEEARRFTETAIWYFQEQDKPLALGALLALMMGLRTSEVFDRVVRDVEDGARYLWIDEGKTQSARRHLEVPSVLRPMLLRLAQGKRPNELLFGVSEVTGKPRPRQAMHSMVQTVCAKAGVPRVCTHSLRGLWATFAVKSGAVSHAVAASLGHHSFAVTQRHYAEAAAITYAATARVLGRLAPNREPAKHSARELLERLDEDTLDQLTELLNVRGPKGRRGN